MESQEGKLYNELQKKIFQILKEFLTRVTKLEELGAVGCRLLSGFQHGLEFLRRPPMNMTSKLIESIVKANETNRIKSYVAAGCINCHDSVQNMSKSKSTVQELEGLLEDADCVIQTANECISSLLGKDFGECFSLQSTKVMEGMPTPSLQEPQITDYAALISIIYPMVKQDYEMQEKIVTSLNLNSSSGELESYCLMWSLRPFINDEILHQAWRLIP